MLKKKIIRNLRALKGISLRAAVYEEGTNSKKYFIYEI